MNKIAIAAVVSCTTLLIWGCSGTIQVVKCSDYQRHSSQIKSIVVIEPDFDQFHSVSQLPPSRQYLQWMEEQTNQCIERCCKLNRVDVTIVDSDQLAETDLDFFTSLIQLKREIWLSGIQMRSPEEELKLKSIPDIGLFKPAGTYLETTPPSFSPKFSWLSEKYGTPYFLCMGIIRDETKEGYTYYYYVLANVVTAEIIYTEVRRTRGKPSISNMMSYIYDSIRIINHK